MSLKDKITEAGSVSNSLILNSFNTTKVFLKKDVAEAVKDIHNDLDNELEDMNGHYVDIRCVRDIIRNRLGEFEDE